jgi:hypothetical protein
MKDDVMVDGATNHLQHVRLMSYKGYTAVRLHACGCETANDNYKIKDVGKRYTLLAKHSR